MSESPPSPPAQTAAPVQTLSSERTVSPEQRHNRTIGDPKVLRAMAHPARLAVLEYLSDGTHATATECAQVCGLSPSAMSYHLRALAKVGMVEEAPSRGDSRERLWRAPDRGFRIDVDNPESPEMVNAAIALVDVLLSRDDEVARRWLARAQEEPPQWYDAAGLTRHQLVMTAAELAALFKAIDELVRPYGRDVRPVPPPDARIIAALFRAFPTD